MLTPERHAPRGLGRPDRAQPLAAAARRGVPRARARLDVRAPAASTRPDFAAALAGLDGTLARPLADDAAQGAPPSTAARTRDRRAELTGAVNTLLLDPDGPRGFNTDVGGIVARPRRRGHRRRRARAHRRRRCHGDVRARRAVGELGVREVEVVARRPAAVAPLAELGASLGIAVVRRAVRRPPATTRCRVTIATLPGDAPVPDAAADALAARGGLLLDVVYGHWPTALASRVGASGPARDLGTRDAAAPGAAAGADLRRRRPRCSPAMTRRRARRDARCDRGRLDQCSACSRPANRTAPNSSPSWRACPPASPSRAPRSKPTSPAASSATAAARA